VDVTVTVVAMNVAEVVPAAIVNDAGTAAAVELSERETTTPPDGAGPERVAVQVLDTPPVTEPGAHCIDVRVITGAVTVNAAVLVTPL
jgi:hypothetical protein